MAYDLNEAMREVTELENKVRDLHIETNDIIGSSDALALKLKKQKLQEEEQAQEELQKTVVKIANKALEQKLRQEEIFKEKQAALNEQIRKAEAEGRAEAAEQLKTQLEAMNSAQAKEGKKLLKQQEKTEKAIEKARKQAKKDQEKEQKAEDRKKQQEATQKAAKAGKAALTEAGLTPQDRLDNLRAAAKDENGKVSAEALLVNMGNALADIAKQLQNNIEEIAKQKNDIDTRLQGTTKNWDEISSTIRKGTLISPYIKQQDVVSKLNELVKRGVAFNVEQRALLGVVKDKIAPTFEQNGLARLIRIQQEDSTAARLGMESALNTFLNQMYQTTEYMSDIMSSIRDSLQEAEMLMGTQSAAAFEYQIQKWLGSYYSVGVSSTAAQNIAAGIGNIAAGKLEGITNGGAGNLIVMAAANSGLSITDILKTGLTDETTNTLLSAITDYIAKIYAETKDNNVVAQQYAQVFGLSATDLKAINNLSQANLKDIKNNMLTYDSMLGQLFSMADTMYQRTSIGEMLSNSMANFKYSMAGGIANSPVLYGIYELSNVLDAIAGGIPIPAIGTIVGSVDLHTTVANLLRLGALGGSIFSALGDLVSGGGGVTGSALLNAFKIGQGTAIKIGSPTSLNTKSGTSISQSGFTGNGSGEDLQNKTLSDAKTGSNQQLVEAQDESEEATTTDINDNLVLIYQLLVDVTSGTKSFQVFTQGNEFGGLAWTGSSNSMTI